MKFPSVGAFDKHLKEAFPNHMAPIFLIVSPSDYERRQVIGKISTCFKPSSLVRFNGLETTPDVVKNELLSPTLWGGVRLVIYDGVEKIKNLSDLLFQFPPQVHLILGSAAFKPLSDFYQKGKKEIVALDLSDEKPWEHERRVQDWMVAKVKEEKKVLSSDAALFLMQSLGPDIAALDQEINKLVCFVGEKERIELADVKAICTSRDLLTGWQLAEKLVWERPIAFNGKDINFIFPFIGQLRYHFQLGLKIAELKGSDLKSHFPTLRNLEKYAGIAKARKGRFFSRGLQALYELEFASKSSGIDIDILFDLFQTKIYEKTLSSS